MMKFHKHNKSKKHKFGKKDKKEFKLLNKRGRLIIRNLPFKCSENSVKEHFSPFGKIIDINLLKRNDGNFMGCGFVEFETRLDADRAIKSLNGKVFLGRPIYIERAVARDRFGHVKEDDMNDDDKLLEEEYIKEEIVEVKEESDDIKPDISDLDSSSLKIKEEILTSDENSDDSDQESCLEDENVDKVISNKKSKNLKRARLIIRNLSFKSSEDKLKEYFEKFGKVVDVQLLRKDDNKLVGCGFVQFSSKQSAAKALFHTSGKPFLDRVIIVDWAVSKNKFENVNKLGEVKLEDDKDHKVKIKESFNSDNIKTENDSDVDSNLNSLTDSESSVDQGDDNENEEYESEDEEKSSNQNQHKVKKEEEKSRFESNDVSEGKTVFLKNVPFSVTNEELKKCMQQFGPVYYALVCVDKLTEHSKGTAFVKFKDVKSAEKCLSSGTELTIKGVVLDPHPALRRSDLSCKQQNEMKQKDNRNLYLVKEGVILAGTQAALGVSQSDMQRRLQLEQWKTQMLRNLNMFVSRGRLIVHNLPPSYDDAKLRNLFKKHAGPKAVIREARVMKDLKNVNEKGIGLSKGHGFVSFTEHADALHALRAINNNPDIFSPSKRPIVAFSIENRAVLNAKTKRAMKSKLNNPLYKGYQPEKIKIQPMENQLMNTVSDLEINKTESKYAGTTAIVGSKKLRTKFNLKNEAAVHLKMSKKLKLRRKIKKRLERNKREFVSKQKTKDQPLPSKKKVDKNEDNFMKICKKYNKKLSVGKAKWYEI
uniref:RRM domain-containing protein n=1 Tax=Clastoptera arizonana TaxID=38151 RepID=A0A1B6CES8_9HEMI